MTGNTSKWRAPLAGLASVAMLATMGVAASTANALASRQSETTYATSVSRATIRVYDASAPYKVIDNLGKNYGEAITASDIDAIASSNKVLDYLSFDKAGANKVATPYVVTGDVKLYAHFKDSVTVTFDKDGKAATDTDRKTIKIAKGTSLTAAEYAEALGANSYGDAVEPADTSTVKFAGWTLTPTLSGTGNDLYTNQSIDADTILYARFDQGQNLAQVNFHEQGSVGNKITRFTLGGTAFPEFRAPTGWAKSTLTNGAFTQWSESDGKTKYDFTKAVENSNEDPGADDLTIVASKSNTLSNVTVKFNSQGAAYTPDTVVTTSDQSIAEPTAPVKAGAVFTGWYLQRTADGQSNPFDFSKSVKDNFNDAKGNITLYAGWDTTHASELVFNLGYADWSKAQQVQYVYAGKGVTLPAGLEEYFQTDAQADNTKGEYTAKTLTGWYEGNDKNVVVTEATAPNAGTVRSYTAVWSGAESLNLNANGGNFSGSVTNQWVTKTDSQKWQDVVVEPTRANYHFVGWNEKADGTGKVANLYDGHWYASGVKGAEITAGVQLYAQWAIGGVDDYNAAFTAFPLVNAGDIYNTPLFSNKSADYKLAEKYAKTEASWKTYVDTVYSLKDEYNALHGLSGQKLVDASKALASKLEAAQAKLIDDKAPAGTTTVYRLFNPNARDAGSHHYTASVVEYNSLVRKGWRAEGVSFVTTSDGKPVYRAYNPNDGGHFYTLSKVELDHAVKAGWKDEGVAFRVSDDSKTPLYRIYNPNSGEHAYTVAANEAKAAVKAGWNDEGIAWNVIK
ncbi:InlB B-repeat-containing protein [Bifidobacterium sp. MA2]|uniref:InlB B-repeat-containing protein n=1 Tax=Bifidobacterium santillanense TaxID=2809028 RepID=A0ABS5USE5_9BIFI|nr:InlB B-repeat-containing protein [Bifidobacterium santillanense]MBT1173862.1 InlB B-repeat-containing protein [Bifidobacterium santillanense]